MTRTVLSFENFNVAEAEALQNAAGNMCGTVAPPEAETNSSRQELCQNWEVCCRPQLPRRSQT